MVTKGKQAIKFNVTSTNHQPIGISSEMDGWSGNVKYFKVPHDPHHAIRHRHRQMVSIASKTQNPL